jgi:predicted HD superfamily hydrolase involved in NAD metabolism
MITKPSRLLHTWGVVETALQLAAAHGVDTRNAGWAALLHDCAKSFDRLRALELMQIHNLATEPEDWDHPAIWHALIGAHLARERFGIEDEAVLAAIRAHPTGEAGMDDLALLLFVSDYVEPRRGVCRLRGAAARNLRASTGGIALLICRSKGDYLTAMGRAIHPALLARAGGLERRVGV